VVELVGRYFKFYNSDIWKNYTSKETRRYKLSTGVKIIVIKTKYLDEITVKRKTPNKKCPEKQ
jgi:hypothetical protein